MSACCATFSEAVQSQMPVSDWFPSEGISKAKNIAIGVIVGLGAYLAVSAISYVLQTHCPWLKVSQDAIKLFNLFKDVHPLLNSAWKGVWRVYVVLAGPVFEELVFRGFLNDKIEKCQEDQESTLKKVVRIALVSIVFGVCHLSPFQDATTNLVIFGITTALGLVFAILKEERKDLSAPVAAHVVFNLASTL